ncbi:DNA-binding protein [Polaromonas naphthalenivorans]|uniref:Uncharacterized protein n=1 Tax=Polaromonas naphthalenivorans (strain CJ2) TaxID=365044 RepID=A1VX72_POLNA|nr:DNA-binding protein [Polaromonas naphthalenivorans]ABM40250.1 hypothetical protein Pnap_5002 [Polaromonas naphthalenivorans CJ2]
MTTDAQAGPITLADVRAALADTDPSRTNAGALRKVLGRGSYATIQKHLDAIRAERAPAPPEAPGAVPAPPAEALHAIWGAAWAQAQVMTLARMERLSAERDTALALAAAQAQDVAGLAAEIDAQAAAAQDLADSQAQALAAAQGVALEATARADRQAQELAAARAEIERITAAAAQAAALAEREATIERQTLQAALERQIDKYTDLKAVVDHLKPMAG